MSQFFQLLSLVILLLQIRLNSSSSILRMKELTSERSSVHTTATTLSGYVTLIEYGESTCTNALVASSYILNSCYRDDSGQYTFVTATSSSVTIKVYTDSSCTLGGTTSSITYTDGACISSTASKVFVSSSSVWKSDSATATAR